MAIIAGMKFVILVQVIGEQATYFQMVERTPRLFFLKHVGVVTVPSRLDSIASLMSSIDVLLKQGQSRPSQSSNKDARIGQGRRGEGSGVTGWQPQAVPIGGYYGYSFQTLAGNGEPHIPGTRLILENSSRSSSPHSQPHAFIRSSELPSIVGFTTSSSSSSSLTLFMASSHRSARFVTKEQYVDIRINRSKLKTKRQ
ncbi:hypothetical protein B0O80DRAFT_431839 [Mortierella sp. GBAus27b]|nr:hypothetical protein B0O80DRAFT_431839 [Mortierella sp. GBAus27b]